MWHEDNGSDRVVVFLHGLHSNSEASWTHTGNGRKTFWPELVQTDSRLGAPAIFLATYYTRPAAGDYGVRDCALEVLKSLRERRGDAKSVLDRSQIVFVGHSTGGVVARYLLESNHQLFADKSVYLLLLASPSAGSWLANLLSGFAALCGHKLAKELRAVSPLLTDLDRRFRALVEEQRIPQLAGAELFEHPPFYKFTVVPKNSAGRYFGEPIAAGGQTHTSICKPPNREHPAHRALVRGIGSLMPVASSEIAVPTTVEGVLEALKANFGFVWEPGDTKNLQTATVFWPVRLRHPTLIHAAQSFCAAALQKAGCRVVLAIDDLGNKDYPVERCSERLSNWYERCGGDIKALDIQVLSSSLGGRDASATYRWASIEHWLGTTQWKLDRILRVCKLLPAEHSVETIQELLSKRPRRLLTPGIVWSALSQVVATSTPETVITLSGFDERPLWAAWRQCAPPSPRTKTGHLYLPDLRVPTDADGSGPLHMENIPLAWQSRDDILDALWRDHRKREQGFEPFSLMWWSLQLCVLMPATLGLSPIQLRIDSQTVRTVHDASAFGPHKSIPALAESLEEVLL